MLTRDENRLRDLRWNKCKPWLQKALDQGLDEQMLLTTRLAPDMLPLAKQIQIASDTSKGAVARLTDTDNPAMADTETTIAELQARIAATVAFIESIDRSAYDGAEDRDVVLPTPGGPVDFKGGAYLTGFALPNFFFHVSIAYALLRHSGAQIGKLDYLGQR